MTIKAILHNGRIQPLEPLPREWTEGQELIIEQPEVASSEVQIRQWETDLEAAASSLPVEEHHRFQAALVEIERESKEAVRREWGLT